ncbi:MAG: UPF0182 family protein, partial [Rubrobacteridae bacterium]|nr:UPF0182 family protein [Rubrobacteridae bacterium]
MKNNRPVITWILFLALFVFFSFSSSLVILYTDWLWFTQIGYASVFTSIISLRILIGLAVGFIFLVFLYANMVIAKRMKPTTLYWVGSPDDPLYKIMSFFKSPVFVRFFSAILFAVALFFAVTAGITASASWQTVLKYLNRSSFGIKDPVFNLDIGFQIFSVHF